MTGKMTVSAKHSSPLLNVYGNCQHFTYEDLEKAKAIE
jgi:hypothetical protein